MVAQRDSRDTWVQVNLACIRDNLQSFRRHIDEKTAMMAVVKADAYGHGAIPVAKTAIAAGASWLGVALLDEALVLREAGITAPILVFGWVRPDQTPLAARHDISLTVYQKDWLEAARLHLGGLHLHVHLKVDTGMGRLGVRDKPGMLAVADTITKVSCFHLQGVYTHFATADEPEGDDIRTQYDRFRQMLDGLREQNMVPDVCHCANSAAALNFPGDVFNLARLGIAMYGLAPSPDMKPELPFRLKPAFSLHSRLVHVKEVGPGEGISYGATYRTKGKEWIGTVPVGYADGWRRRLSNDAEVLVDGERVPIVGRVCMDFFMVRLPEAKPVGQEVTLIGSQGETSIDMDEIADRLGTINYEIPCMITARVPRMYRRR